MISLLDLRFISGRRNSNIDRTNVNEDKLTLTTCSDQTFGIMNESLFLDTLSSIENSLFFYGHFSWVNMDEAFLIFDSRRLYLSELIMLQSDML